VGRFANSNKRSIMRAEINNEEKGMETAIGIIGILVASTVAGVIMYFIAKWARGKQGGTK